MHSLFPVATLAEIFIFFAALLSIFLKYEYPVPDAFPYAFVLCLSIYSLSIQLFLLFDISNWFFIIEAIIVIFSLVVLTGKWQLLLHSSISSLKKISSFKYSSILLFVFFYLFLQVLLLPTLSWDCFGYHLPRVLMMMQEGSLFLKNFSTFNQSTFLVGSDVLHFLFLRFSSDWFSGIFNFLAYTTTLISTYSLVKKRFNDEHLGMVAAIVIGSLVTIVLQSTSQKNDLYLTALTSTCFLAIYNFLFYRDIFSTLIIFTCLAFGISIKPYFIGFFISCSVLLIIFYHRDLLNIIKTFDLHKLKKYTPLLLIPLGLTTCLLIFLFHNYSVYGNFFGYPPHIHEHINRDGLLGALHNAVRYVLEMIIPPRQIGGEAIDTWYKMVFSQSHDLGKALLLKKDFSISKNILSLPEEYLSWYGPFSLIIVLPAIFYAAFRGDQFLKLVSFSLLLFAFAICYKVGWMPWNNRFFSAFFGASGLCVAFFIKKLFQRRYFNIIICLNLIIMAHTAFFNTDKPLVSKFKIALFVHNNLFEINQVEKRLKHAEPHVMNLYPVGTWLYYAINRNINYDFYYGDDRLRKFSDKVKQNSKVLIFADKDSWVLPFFLVRPDLTIYITGRQSKFFYDQRYFDVFQKNDFQYLQKHFNYFLFISEEPPFFLDHAKLILKCDKYINWEGKELGDSFHLYDYHAASSSTPKRDF